MLGALPISEAHKGLDQVGVEAQQARLAHLLPRTDSPHLLQALAGRRPLLPAHGEQALDGQHIAEDGARLETLGEIPGLVEMGPAFIVPPGRGFEAREADQAVGPAALCTGLVREADRLGGVGVSAQPAAGAKLQLRQDGQRVREEGGGAGGPQLSDFGFERAERRFEVFGADLAERAIAGRHGIGNPILRRSTAGCGDPETVRYRKPNRGGDAGRSELESVTRYCAESRRAGEYPQF